MKDKLIEKQKECINYLSKWYLTERTELETKDFLKLVAEIKALESGLKEQPEVETSDLFQQALKFLDNKNIPSLVDKGYIARWMTDFASQSQSKVTDTSTFTRENK